MNDTPLLVTLFLSLVSLFAIVRRKLNPVSSHGMLRRALNRRHFQIHSIPTVGPSAPILSYVGAYRFLHNAEDMLREGYHKVLRMVHNSVLA